MDFSAIRHIILDLGGVILNIDYDRTAAAFAALGIPHFSRDYFSQAAQAAVMDDFETGKISSEKFIESMLQALPQGTTAAQVTEAWNAMLADFPMRRLRLLQQLRNQYDLFLLSNTNELHEAAFNKILHDTCGFPSLAAMFDKVYLSHRIGLRKPGAEVFTHILEENGLKAAYTLFIDDSAQHIQAAASLGIRTIHLTPGMTLEDDIFLPRSSRELNGL